ncbi:MULTISPECIES: zf-HC2 domain-containing protein [unclassified Sedimentibacter]|uniref:zf-HC2 domain-containing protein n=1 Tax=unclassified Sedimentibacter TaxID=2649220 RepID=UPI0027E19CCA|nr:zf-HC2 domain-containing protein [Sedimentibacter sp. MB35-C1]WMJ77125.1 zf-HC2 domain-containing protein [Sedimentibacter sp. MB35-C1]
MKITCNVIKDILPLYVENMVSNDSRAMIEEHIEQCQECKVYLDEMKTFNKIPIDTNITPLLNIKSTLRKKKIQTAIFSMMFLIIVLVITTAFLTAPEYIPYSEGSVAINEIGNGSVLATFDDTVYGYDISSYPTDGNTGYVYHITTWNSIWNRNIKKSNVNNTIINPNGENVVSVYYYQTDGSEDKLIYGKNINSRGGVITLPRLFLSYYSRIAMILALIFGFIILLFNRNRKVNSFMKKIFLLPVSYLLGQLIIKGFTTSSYNATRDFYAILLIMIPIYIASLMALNIISAYKREK